MSLLVLLPLNQSRVFSEYVGPSACLPGVRLGNEVGEAERGVLQLVQFHFNTGKGVEVQNCHFEGGEASRLTSLS